MAGYLGFEPAEHPPYYFVSYSNEDAERLTPLIKGCHDAGIPLWYDEGILPGVDWEEEIARRIDESEGVILFWTNSIFQKKSPYVRKEHEIAIRYDKKIVVVMSDKIGAERDIPYAMQGWWSDIKRSHRISAYDNVNPTQTIRKLKQAFNLLTSNPPAQSTEVPENKNKDTSELDMVWFRKYCNASKLANLTQLTSLDLDKNQITDITPLARLNNLKELHLSGNPVSKTQIAALRKALPNCEINT